MREQKTVEVTAADLPLHCPMPGQGDSISHPRVFLPIEDKGEARCPYCSTVYKLTGPVKHGHH
ncbi:MAG: zinc-finger domain-containing protein [Gallionellaceae bacterium]|nr:zinc-finger domain-containing protein [Gallionellaceae bacterium]MDD5365790.1 zinc-finger domain-containing protein [Gallionellaceae bacterium]